MHIKSITINVLAQEILTFEVKTYFDLKIMTSVGIQRSSRGFYRKMQGGMLTHPTK